MSGDALSQLFNNTGKREGRSNAGGNDPDTLTGGLKRPNDWTLWVKKKDIMYLVLVVACVEQVPKKTRKKNSRKTEQNKEHRLQAE